MRKQRTSPWLTYHHRTGQNPGAGARRQAQRLHEKALAMQPVPEQPVSRQVCRAETRRPEYVWKSGKENKGTRRIKR